MKESKRKELETRKMLGPRLPKSERIRPVYADPPRLRLRGRHTERPPDHPTRDSG